MNIEDLPKVVYAILFQYLGRDDLKNLRLENINSQEANIAIKELTQSLLANAEAKALQKRIDEEAQRIAEARITSGESEMNWVEKTTEALESKLRSMMGVNTQSQYSFQRMVALARATDEGTEAIAAYQKRLDELAEKYPELNREIREATTVLDDLNTGGLQPASDEMAKLIDQITLAQSKLTDELIKIRQQRHDDELSADDKEIARIQDKYDKQFAIVDENEKQLNEIIASASAEQRKQAEEELRTLKANRAEIYALMNEEILAKQDEFFQRDLKKLKANHEKVELELMDEREKQILKIEDHYKELINLEGIHQDQIIELEERKNQAIAALRQKDTQILEKKLQEQFRTFQEFYNLAADVLHAHFELQDNKRNIEMDRFNDEQNRKKQGLQNRLDSELISQEEYDAEIQRMEREKAELDKKNRIEAFKREQSMRIVQTLINTAAAVMRAFAEGGLAGSIVAAVAGATQMGLIKAQKPPEFRDGGKLEKGVSHNHPSGGMPVIDPTTGNTEALLEAGEWIVNKRSSAVNDDILRWMKSNPGKRIPQLSNAIPRMDVNSAQSVVRMDKGGVFERMRPSVSVSPRPGDNMSHNFDALLAAVRELIEQSKLTRAELAKLKLTFNITDFEEIEEDKVNLETLNKFFS
jgi:hypothetical protein